jgi:uncharacterized spore protein YtfJ
MNDMNAVLGTMNQAQERTIGLLDKLVETANPRSVYSEPVISGEHLVVTASEVWTGVGFGSGGGVSPTPAPGQGQGAQGAQAGGPGIGQGGGGGATGRPVAVIDISPQGVQIHPVFDVAKLGLAALTTLSTMAITIGRVTKSRRH